jgi:sarcosine oxidase gamma subunit
MRGVRRQGACWTCKLRLREASKIISRILETSPKSLQQASNSAESPQNTVAMKLNVKNIRYLSPDDWRVLTAVCAPIPRVP